MNQRPRIIDAHLHLDPREGSALQAVQALNLQLKESGVERAVILHLEVQPWSAEDVAEALAPHNHLTGLVNIHPFDPDALEKLDHAVDVMGFTGLKTHPRIQKYDIEDPRVEKLIRYAGKRGVPVLMDAFPDGDWLMMGFDPLKFYQLAKRCPETKIVFAHFGGHRCLDMMMLAKRIPNVYLDLSYSLLYYRGSHIIDDLIYCFRSMKFQRIFYGTDYPDRPIEESVQGSLRELRSRGVEGDDLDQILYANARDFYHWNLS